MNLVFFDLETQKLAAEVGGWHNIRLLRMACAVTYSTSSGQYAAYSEDEVPALVQQLRTADRVVGFNVKRFDYEVLRYYFPFEPFHLLPTLDLLQVVQDALGFRLGLDALAHATLGVPKSAGGLQSVEWFRQGLYDRVREYCQSDVELTRRLYDHGCENGCLYYYTKLGARVQLCVNWKLD